MLHSMARALGIDYGTKRTGVALSDEAKQFAFPHTILSTDRELTKTVCTLVGEYDVDTVVIGHSATLSGEDNPVMRGARALAEQIHTRCVAGSTKIVFESEVFTSRHALRQFESKEKTRKPPKKHTIDDSAAALILQSYLDTPMTDNIPTQPAGATNEPEQGIEKCAPEASTEEVQAVAPASPKITIDDFKKVEMTIGEIKTAERVPDTDKLIRLTVDVGESEPRQIISGIAAWFPEPSVLVGKKVPFVTNLEPRTMRGLESNGMILAAHDTEEHFSLLEVDSQIAAGTRLS